MFLDNASYRDTIQKYQSGEIEELDTSIEDYQTNALISLILGVGSIIFTIGPYILNMYFAANIKNNPIIKDNKSALNYFNNNATLFIVLTVLSGGVYASLSVVSSMIFGLSLFNTGLTKFELNKLTKIKLISTICCENLPQLLLQILYFAQFGFVDNSNARDAAMLAFVGSILSVILSVLVWYVNKKEEGILPVIYYVEFSKQRRIKLNKNEKQLFLKKKLIRKEFILRICQDVMNISRTIIQISYVNVIDCGILIRFVHFVDNNDLITMQRSLRNDTSKKKHKKKYSNNFDSYNDMFVGLSPKFYTKKLFKQHKKDLLSMYFDFFELDSVTSINLYDLKYYDEIPTYIDTANNTVTKLSVFNKKNHLNEAIQLASINSDSNISNIVITLKDEVKSLKKQLKKEKNKRQKKIRKKFEKIMYNLFDDTDSDTYNNNEGSSSSSSNENNDNSSINDGNNNDNNHAIPKTTNTKQRNHLNNKSIKLKKVKNNNGGKSTSVYSYISDDDDMKYTDDSDDIPQRNNNPQILTPLGPNMEIRMKSNQL